ncbi:hypothetical protein NL676_000028 [Syzygium grande]|nr:hypothetical protein NL676_000028 [Syzygium grande]
MGFTHGGGGRSQNRKAGRREKQGRKGSPAAWGEEWRGRGAGGAGSGRKADSVDHDLTLGGGGNNNKPGGRRSQRRGMGRPVKGRGGRAK